MSYHLMVTFVMFKWYKLVLYKEIPVIYWVTHEQAKASLAYYQTFFKTPFSVLNHLSRNISWTRRKLHGITILVVNINQLFETQEKLLRFKSV